HRCIRRVEAVELAVENDDGQSVRAFEKADVILVAPSRCGRTPTSMYLALMHGVFIANYPLVDEDLSGEVLPGAIAGLADRCFGLLTTPERRTAVRSERRSGSRYASLEQPRWELSRARRQGRGEGRRLREPERVLRPARGRGRRHDRRRLPPRAGDRADERLQVQRVREP